MDEMDEMDDWRLLCCAITAKMLILILLSMLLELDMPE